MKMRFALLELALLVFGGSFGNVKAMSAESDAKFSQFIQSAYEKELRRKTSAGEPLGVASAGAPLGVAYELSEEDSGYLSEPEFMQEDKSGDSDSECSSRGNNSCSGVIDTDSMSLRQPDNWYFSTNKVRSYGRRREFKFWLDEFDNLLVRRVRKLVEKFLLPQEFSYYIISSDFKITAPFSGNIPQAKIFAQFMKNHNTIEYKIRSKLNEIYDKQIFKLRKKPDMYITKKAQVASDGTEGVAGALGTESCYLVRFPVQYLAKKTVIDDELLEIIYHECAHLQEEHAEKSVKIEKSYTSECSAAKKYVLAGTAGVTIAAALTAGIGLSTVVMPPVAGVALLYAIYGAKRFSKVAAIQQQELQAEELAFHIIGDIELFRRYALWQASADSQLGCFARLKNRLWQTFSAIHPHSQQVYEHCLALQQQMTKKQQ